MALAAARAEGSVARQKIIMLASKVLFGSTQQDHPMATTPVTDTVMSHTISTSVMYGHGPGCRTI